MGDRNSIEAQATRKIDRLSGAKTHIKNLLTEQELQAVIDGYLGEVDREKYAMHVDSRSGSGMTEGGE